MLREPYKGDWIKIRNMPAPEEDIIQSIADRQLVKLIWVVLSARERIAVTRYYFDDGTLGSVGTEMKVGRERVRQILGKAQRKMRRAAERLGVREYEDGTRDRETRLEAGAKEREEARRKQRDAIAKQKIEVGNSLDQFLRLLPPGDPRRTTSPAGFVCEPHPADPNLFVFRWVKPLPWA